MHDENVYQTPKANLNIEPAEASRPLFFPTSQLKLVTLFIATLGLYTVYWFYKNWKMQQPYLDKKIQPALRSLFYIFFTHSLFKRVELAANDKGISKSWSAATLATVFVALTVISTLLDRVAAKSETIGVVDYINLLSVFVLVIPLYRVQAVVNKINSDPQGELNDTFSFYNFIFIAIGIMLWLLALIGMLGPDLEFLTQLDGQ